MRILVVEDHADSARMIHRILMAKGHEVRTVPAGVDAIRACDEWAFQLMIADIGLPDIDGWELLRRVRERRGNAVRAIAVTGHALNEDLQRSSDAGFDAHLTKPVDLAALSRAIESATRA